MIKNKNYINIITRNLVVTHGLLLVTPLDIPTHISGNVIDLGFCSPSLFMAVDATVNPSICVGSDHLPIQYTVDFEVTLSKSIKFNTDKMDLDSFIAVLHDMRGCRSLPVITTLDDLDATVDFLNEVILAALEKSTPRHRPCSAAKRWWKPLLTTLRSSMRNKRRIYQHTRVDSARRAWLEA
jgi:hypothetical protein